MDVGEGVASHCTNATKNSEKTTNNTKRNCGSPSECLVVESTPKLPENVNEMSTICEETCTNTLEKSIQKTTNTKRRSLVDCDNDEVSIFRGSSIEFSNPRKLLEEMDVAC